MSLLEKHPQAPATWQGDLPITNRYTLGIAGERFFRAIKDEGRIYGSYCDECDITYVPAVTYCERCLSELTDWVDIGTTGEVHTYTLLYVNYDGTPRHDPEIIVFVRMGDGGIVHRLGELDPQEVEIGMLVEAVFKPAKQRQGSILDIDYFRPI